MISLRERQDIITPYSTKEEIAKYLNSALDVIIQNQDYEYFYLIDFGLSYISQVIEDKAVDLYVLKRAIISANPRSEEIVKKNLLKNYILLLFLTIFYSV